MLPDFKLQLLGVAQIAFFSSSVVFLYKIEQKHRVAREKHLDPFGSGKMATIKSLVLQSSLYQWKLTDKSKH